jgi:CheY-like chemotaxis protein
MANILIVDGYISIGLLYSEVLQDEGHRVLVAMSGKEALLLALHERIDLVVVDDKLPDLEAEEVLRKLKQVQPHTRGILIISSTFIPSGDLCLWDGIFSKTHDFRILKAEIKRVWQGSSSKVSKPIQLDKEHQSEPRFISAPKPSGGQTS